MVHVIETQATPNPDSLKFITDAALVAQGALSFESPEAAKGHALAEAIFSSGPVASVFVMDRFVTITKFPDADWPLIKARLVAAIETTAAPAATGGAAATPGSTDEKLALINAVIDENVRPALAGDGGGLEVLEFSDNVLTVHYQGACGSCASATSGALYAIQNLLQRMVDPKIQVVSV